MHIPLRVSPDLLDALPLTGKSSALGLWEHRTNNVFRGVIELDCTGMTPAEVSDLVLDTVASEYAPGMIVPFAFGTVLHFKSQAPESESLQHLVDDRSRSRGTWQWLVAVDESARSAHGIHMWATGYLTPIFASALEQFRSQGYSCHSSTKEPGAFWGRLWAISHALPKIRKVLLYIGTGLVLLLLVVQVLRLD